MAAGNILNRDEEKRLVDRIRKAEKKTTAEIHIHLVKRGTRKGALADCARIFHKLKLDRTSERNGVMLLVEVKDHKFACYGDAGVQKKLGVGADDFWKKIAATLEVHFRKGDFYIGLHGAVETVAEMLARYFPAGPKDENPNILPDEISRS